jgi:hypothetical protein
MARALVIHSARGKPQNGTRAAKARREKARKGDDSTLSWDVLKTRLPSTRARDGASLGAAKNTRDSGVARCLGPYKVKVKKNHGERFLSVCLRRDDHA